MNKYDYNNLTPFKWFVLENFPFIEADFDALTNWQLFCKLGKEMNKLIDTMNNVGQGMEDFSQELINSFNEFTTEINTTVEDYITRFNQLKDFVDNYFDNLDVQEEINNKLDDMVEAGTLQEIISDYLNSKAIFGYDTVADMKEATNLIDGSFAKTLGFYAKNDSGNGLYKIRELLNNETANNMNLIELDNGLVAELIIENDTINIMQFGAYENNSNKYNENKTIIETALNKASNVIVPKGIFYTNSIEMPKQTTLKGTNNKLSILRYKGNNNNSLIKIGATSQCFDTKIENLQLEQIEGLENINAIEYIGTSTAYSTISHCNIFNFSGDGIKGGHAGHVNNILIKENFISGCYNNINMQYNVGQINAIYIQNNNIVAAKHNGIVFAGNNVVIEKNTIQANYRHAISISDENWDTNHNQNIFGSTIQNNYTEANGNNFEYSVIGIYAGYVSGRTYNRLVRKLNILNNFFSEYNNDYSIIHCEIDNSTSPSSKACMINVQNNYSQSTKFVSFNLWNALSFGTIIKNNSGNLTDSSNYPFWVQQNEFDINDSSGVHYDNYQKSLYQNFGTMTANSNKQLTFLIYYDSSTATRQVLDQAIEQTASKIVVNGHKDWGLAGNYNTLLEKFGNNVDGNDGKITKEVATNATTVVPDISPITLVENHSQITGNATKALQITIAQHNNYAFPYSILMEFMNNRDYNKLLKIKRIETEIKGGSSAPSGNIDYVGQVYINTSNRKWYVASDLENWREATTN